LLVHVAAVFKKLMIPGKSTVAQILSGTLLFMRQLLPIIVVD
jgi:hypothetical protein